MPINLCSVAEGLPDEVGLAIVIAGKTITRADGQYHAGFVVKGSDNLYLFHLATHNCFCRDTVNDKYAYTLDDFLDPFSANAIVAFLALLYKNCEGKIPYAIKYEEDSYFDTNNAELLKVDQGQGLTCATFVLEVLARYGFDIVDRSSWPILEENTNWQKNILNRLIRSNPQSVDDFLVQFKHLGSAPRFTPEQVIGAASTYVDEALNFSEVDPLVPEVRAELHRLNFD